MPRDKQLGSVSARTEAMKETFKEGFRGYFNSAKDSLIFANKVGRVARIGMGLGLPTPDLLSNLPERAIKAISVPRQKDH